MRQDTIHSTRRTKEGQGHLNVCVYVYGYIRMLVCTNAECGVKQGSFCDLLVHPPPSHLSAIYYTIVYEHVYSLLWMKTEDLQSSSPSIIQAINRLSSYPVRKRMLEVGGNMRRKSAQERSELEDFHSGQNFLSDSNTFFISKRL